jgi:hypothetical protein
MGHSIIQYSALNESLVFQARRSAFRFPLSSHIHPIIPCQIDKFRRTLDNGAVGTIPHCIVASGVPRELMVTPGTQ